MIERVAKIIYEAMAYEREIPKWVDRGNSFAQDECRLKAISAIEAMREPSSDMVTAAKEKMFGDGPRSYYGPLDDLDRFATEVLKSGITAALEGE